MNGCSGLAPYRSWSDANKTMKRVRYGDNMRDRRSKAVIYRCRQCQHWHIGRSS